MGQQSTKSWQCDCLLKCSSTSSRIFLLKLICNSPFALNCDFRSFLPLNNSVWSCLCLCKRDSEELTDEVPYNPLFGHWRKGVSKVLFTHGPVLVHTEVSALESSVCDGPGIAITVPTSCYPWSSRSTQGAAVYNTLIAIVWWGEWTSKSHTKSQNQLLGLRRKSNVFHVSYEDFNASFNVFGDLSVARTSRSFYSQL